MEDLAILDRLQQKIAHYEPNAAAVTLLRETPLLILVGISGAGKDSIIRQLLKTGKYHPIVSHTTRHPRVNDGVAEQNGVEYHFISHPQAEAMLDHGTYIEANLYSGNVYGASISEIEAAHREGKIAVSDFEVKGVARYMAMTPNAHAAFILPPSYEVWQQRFMKRHGGNMSEHDIEKRMRTALDELEHALATPYYTFIVNDSLDAAVQEVDALAHGVLDRTDAAAARRVAMDICQHLKLVHAA